MEREPRGDLSPDERPVNFARYICVELISDDDQVELKAVPRNEAIEAGFFSHGMLSDEIDEDKLEALWNESIDLPANWN